MNFQQLRIVRETVRRNFNLTEVANALFTSQSGVSKHIKDLEDELGVELFVRRGKRLTGLTDPGKDVINVVERILIDTANIKRPSQQFSSREEGQLVIATTHTQARYVLAHTVASFRTAFPKVRLTLHQGSPTEIAAMLSDVRPGCEVVPTGTPRRLGIGRNDADARLREIAPVPDAPWGCPCGRHEGGGVGRGIVRQALLPVGGYQLPNLVQRIDVIGERQRHHIGLGAIDKGARLLGGATARLLDRHLLAGLRSQCLTKAALNSW